MVIRAAGLDRTDRPLNVFFHLFARHEPAALAITGGLAPVLLLALRASRAPVRLASSRSRRLVWALAGLVLAATATGAFVVHHAYPLSMDEYLADFQADLLVEGRVSAEIPAEWRDAGWALTPVFAVHDAAQGSWHSSYLPVYAAMRAVAGLAGLRPVTNALLAGATVLLVAAAARRLWPDPWSPLVAAVLLATSSQFLLTSTSAYAMPAHAFLNALWLHLYLVRSRAAMALLPGVSFLAMGLHHLVPHSLFLAPFLLRLARRPDAAAVWVIGGSALSLLFWAAWTRASFQGTVSLLGPHKGLPAEFGVPGAGQMFVQAMNLALMVSWQPLALTFLVGLCIWSWRRWPEALRDVGAGCLLTLAFYVLYRSDQGHGWGYRYMYPMLPGLLLVATAGWHQIVGRRGMRAGVAVLAASAAVALLGQIPLRTVQVREFVRPFAEASRGLAALPADIVVLDWRDHWYAQDLIRNDPSLTRRPLLAFADRLAADQLARWRESGKSIHVVKRGELTRWGVPELPADFAVR